MRAITLRHPWASAIVHLGKDVENRSWSTGHRGPLAIHAGLKLDAEAPAHVGEALSSRVPSGFVVAVVQLRDVVKDSGSAWAVSGLWHWLLDEMQPLAVPVRCSGRQGLFSLPVDVEEKVVASLYGEE